MSISFETELMLVKENILQSFILLGKVVGLLWNDHTGFLEKLKNQVMILVLEIQAYLDFSLMSIHLFL